jgi:hypothetical protein
MLGSNPSAESGTKTDVGGEQSPPYLKHQQ